MRRAVPLLLFLLAIGVTACSPGSIAIPTTTSTIPPSTTQPIPPAGPTPSVMTRETCWKTAEAQVAQTLGVAAKISHPTWTDHLYSCDYVYRNGRVALSVKELSSWAQTYMYLNSVQAQQGDAGLLTSVAKQAFATRDGSLVIPENWTILEVDIKGLPEELGDPPTARPAVAYDIAEAILDLWGVS